MFPGEMREKKGATEEGVLRERTCASSAVGCFLTYLGRIRRNLGEQALSIFLLKIIAAIMIFIVAKGWGENENCIHGHKE